jgi:hypothetical protein
MSHFYAEIQGNRGAATRGGSKDSGISGHIRGWSVGARVECYYDDETGKDIVKVYKTHGSNGSGNTELIAQFCNEAYHNKLDSACDYCSNRFKCFTDRK